MGKQSQGKCETLSGFTEGFLVTCCSIRRYLVISQAVTARLDEAFEHEIQMYEKLELHIILVRAAIDRI